MPLLLPMEKHPGHHQRHHHLLLLLLQPFVP
jgi:hypothetical protein